MWKRNRWLVPMSAVLTLFATVPFVSAQESKPSQLDLLGQLRVLKVVDRQAARGTAIRIGRRVLRTETRQSRRVLAKLANLLDATPQLSVFPEIGMALLPEIRMQLSMKGRDSALRVLETLAPHFTAAQANAVARDVLAGSRFDSDGFSVLIALGERVVDLVVSEISKKPKDVTSKLLLRQFFKRRPQLVESYWHRLGAFHDEIALSGFFSPKKPTPWMAERLVKLAEHGDPFVRARAFEALRDLGPVSVPALEKLIGRTKDFDDKTSILWVAHRIGPEAAPLIRGQIQLYCDDCDQNVREWVIRTLPRFGPKGITAIEMIESDNDYRGPPLSAALRSADPATRQAAARALIKIRFVLKAGDERKTVSTLTGLLPMIRSEIAADRDWGSAALIGLLDLFAPTKQLGEGMRAVMARAGNKSRVRMLKALKPGMGLRRLALPIFEVGLQDDAASVRVAALHSIATWGDRAVSLRPRVLGLRNDADESVGAAVEPTLKRLR